MTCNSAWDEINQMMKWYPGCLATDSPDIIARVFKLKLDQIVEDMKNKHYFGVCIAGQYLIYSTNALYTLYIMTYLLIKTIFLCSHVCC